MIRRLWLALAVAIGLAIPPAVAQSVPEAKCTAKGQIPDDERISGCSTLLESNKYGTTGSLTGLFIRAKTSFRKKLFDAAIADYTEIIQRFPKNEFAYLERGVTYYNKGEFQRAIDDYDHVIELNPRFERAYYDRGAANLRKGDFDQSIADYNQAIALKPNDAYAYVYRSAVYRAKGELDQAMADCAQAMKIAPENKFSYFCRAITYKAMGDVAHAIADYDHVIELDAKDASAYRFRGTIYFLSGAFVKALADFDQSIQLAPEQAYAALWRDLAARRASQPSTLKEGMSRLDMTKWPAPLVRLLIGEISAEEMFSGAADANAAIKKGQICEANFYTAELALQRSEKDEAARLLRLAVDECPKSFVEYSSAKAELRALENP